MLASVYSKLASSCFMAFIGPIMLHLIRQINLLRFHNLTKKSIDTLVK